MLKLFILRILSEPMALQSGIRYNIESAISYLEKKCLDIEVLA